MREGGGSAEEAETSQDILTANGVELYYVVEGRGTPLLVIGSAIYYPRTFSERLREYFKFYFVDLQRFAGVARSFTACAILPQPTSTALLRGDIKLSIPVRLEKNA